VTRALARELTVTSLPSLDAHACADPRFPALLGAWALGCDAEGRVALALHLPTRRTATLERPVERPSPATDGSARLYAAGVGVWMLPTAPTEHLRVTPSGSWPAVAASGKGAGFDGVHAAIALPEGVDVHAEGTRARRVSSGKPHSVPAALRVGAVPFAAWAELGPDGSFDLRYRGADALPKPLAEGPGDAWRVVASERWWHAVVQGDLRTWEVGADGQVRDLGTLPAQAGFVDDPSGWGPVACWSDRTRLREARGDVDVRCSDGWDFTREGAQLAPSRSGPWLLVREGAHTRLFTLPAVLLDDDDPRAQAAGAKLPGGVGGSHHAGLVRWELSWPAPGWRAEAWDGAEWRDLGPLATGSVSVTSPFGDALRLRPDAPRPPDSGAGAREGAAPKPTPRDRPASVPVRR
jgi:hypothetical protein